MNIQIFATLGLLAFCSAAPATDSGVVGLQGLGPAKFGMSLKQFNRATGARAQAPKEKDQHNCFYVEAARWPDVRFMFENQRLRRIDVQAKYLSTARKIHVGDAISRIEAAYGASVVDEPHHYSGPEDRYMTVQLSRSIAVRFETSAKRVDSFYVGGTRQVQYVEGCF